MANQITGSINVSTAGTAVRVTTRTDRVIRAYFKPNENNSGACIYVGDSTVSSTNGMSRSDQTTWGGAFEYYPVSVSADEFYVDVDTNNDDVDYLLVLGAGRQ